MVLEFLRGSCDEANTFNMGEAQAYVALSYFLKRLSLVRFRLSSMPTLLAKQVLPVGQKPFSTLYALVRHQPLSGKQ